MVYIRKNKCIVYAPDDINGETLIFRVFFLFWELFFNKSFSLKGYIIYTRMRYYAKMQYRVWSTMEVYF